MRPSDAAVCGNVALPRRALSAFLRTLWNVEPALLAMPEPAALDEFTNPRLYAPGPSYRDDNRALWRADPPKPVAPEPAASTPQPDSTEPPAEVPLTMSVRARHTEWDWLIARYRNDWCTVLDTPAPDSADAGLPTALPPDPSLVRRLRRTLQRSRDTRTLARDGEQIDLDALLRWAIATRSGRPGDERVHRQRQRGPDRSALLLLLDLSASSGERVAEGLASVLDTASAAASALQASGGACAIDGFHSNGRHEVHYERIKGFDTPLAPNALASLRSGGSTRLGAALRHATATLAGRHGERRTLLVLTDGQAHDVDVHDPRYLIEDARRAVREAAQQGVLTVCITLGSQSEPSAQRIFGAKHCRSLRQVERLPRAIAQLGL